MPTYDYECQACGHAFERYQTMTARKLRTCPACRKRRLVRLVGAGSGIIFRGSGFYETDYKRAGSGGDGSSSGKGAGKGGKEGKTSEGSSPDAASGGAKGDKGGGSGSTAGGEDA